MALYPGKLFERGAASQPVSIRAMTLGPGKETTITAFPAGKLNEDTPWPVLVRRTAGSDVLSA